MASAKKLGRDFYLSLWRGFQQSSVVCTSLHTLDVITEGQLPSSAIRKGLQVFFQCIKGKSYRVFFKFSTIFKNVEPIRKGHSGGGAHYVQQKGEPFPTFQGPDALYLHTS